MENQTTNDSLEQDSGKLIIPKIYFRELGIGVENNFSRFIKQNYSYAYEFQFNDKQEATDFAMNLPLFAKRIDLRSLATIYNIILAFDGKY